ncbi:MAG: RNA polymerase sigma factor FliA [Pseudomonadales bacterium]
MQKLSMYSNEQQQNRTAMLVEQHAPLVKRIAHHLLARLPSTVQLNDLIQSGMVGLLEASQKFDVSKGASFETFAGIRVRGAMLDDVRKDDWAPRSVHRNSRRVSAAIKKVESRTGRDASDSDVAAELGIPLDEYYAYLQDSAGTRLFSFDEVTEHDESALKITSSNESTPQDEVQQQDFKDNLAEAISLLPERERMVLALYYQEELNLKEIGSLLGVSESRVSQIHSQAALRLRTRLADWGNG